MIGSVFFVMVSVIQVFVGGQRIRLRHMDSDVSVHCLGQRDGRSRRRVVLQRRCDAGPDAGHRRTRPDAGWRHRGLPRDEGRVIGRPTTDHHCVQVDFCGRRLSRRLLIKISTVFKYRVS